MKTFIEIVTSKDEQLTTPETIAVVKAAFPNIEFLHKENGNLWFKRDSGEKLNIVVACFSDVLNQIRYYEYNDGYQRCGKDLDKSHKNTYW